MQCNDIMYVYYYRVWSKTPEGRYDRLVYQGSFEAEGLEKAHSRALQIVKMWGDTRGDVSLEYQTSVWARSPYVVYFPPF